jgi:hypothetical protein
VPRLLTLIDEHPVHGDQALARILDRYAACRPLEIEPDLRDASINRWANPWLEHNDAKWALVKPETRALVSSWVKLRLIDDFFRLLADDGLNDRRRIDFWKRYVDRITDMHFALGEAAYRDSRPDFRSLRQAMKGRLLRLESGGGARNNAFIMRIGGHVVVEFGEKGNAMFAFEADALPFDLRGGYVAGNRTALKHPKHLARLIHMDGSGERWERKFERKLDELGGRRSKITAGSGSAHRVTTTGQASASQWASTWTRPGSAGADPPALAVSPGIGAAGDPSAFLKGNGVTFVDSRPKGGALWAYAPERTPLAADLRRRGFTWSHRRAAWFLKS